jgi:endonuclease/exonuclease/phosphatase family metal-dependent hydrolase
MNTWAAKEGNSVAFISAKPVEDYKWHYHPRLQRAFMEIKLPNLTIYGVHLRATHSNYTERGRMREVKALLDAVGDRRREPHILTGDFNTLAPGELLNMQKLPWRYRILALLLGGRVTYHTIQIMLDEGYVDSYRLMNTDHGFTFPAWDPHVRLDYFFIPAAHAGWVRNCSVIQQVKGAETASDHFPLLAEVDIAE